MEKTGYRPAYQGTSKVKVYTDEDGYLIPEGSTEYVAGDTRITINKVAADNNLQDNTDVFNFFLDLAGGKQNTDTNTMSVTWGV